MMLDKLKENSALFEGSDYIAVLSDRVDCGKYKNGGFVSAKDESKFDPNKLLELRIFNKKREYRAFRDNLGEAGFMERIAEDGALVYGNRADDDSELRYNNCFDELHYLDYDEQRTRDCSEPNAVFTTGGGTFYLEGIDDKCKVLVRTYLKTEPQTGLEYAFDWRVVGYRKESFRLPGKEKKDGEE